MEEEKKAKAGFGCKGKRVQEEDSQSFQMSGRNQNYYFLPQVAIFCSLCYPDTWFNLSSSSALHTSALSGRTMENFASCVLLSLLETKKLSTVWGIQTHFNLICRVKLKTNWFKLLVERTVFPLQYNVLLIATIYWVLGMVLCIFMYHFIYCSQGTDL